MLNVLPGGRALLMLRPSSAQCELGLSCSATDTVAAQSWEKLRSATRQALIFNISVLVSRLARERGALAVEGVRSSADSTGLVAGMGAWV